uniref:Cwf18 pre-mRNA splicing factor n=1 Tax=Wuchereria bancrofti TaxID=6293 RepID=A0AAF5PRG8_WUCBA
MVDGIVEEQKIDEIDIAETSISLEKEANERKQRIREMRERMQQEGKLLAFSRTLKTVQVIYIRIIDVQIYSRDGSESGSSNKSLKLTFRSYEPQSDLGEKRDDVDLFAVEKEIADQLADTQDTRAVEQIDITTLAPRKIDWDLKRDIAEKLEKLERRTERAMAQLIRERLKAGKTELVDAVNSGAYSELQPDE